MAGILPGHIFEGLPWQAQVACFDMFKQQETESITVLWLVGSLPPSWGGRTHIYNFPSLPVVQECLLGIASQLPAGQFLDSSLASCPKCRLNGGLFSEDKKCIPCNSANMFQSFLIYSHPVNLTQFHLSATRQEAKENPNHKLRSDVCAFWKQKKYLPQSLAGYPYVQAGHWFEPMEKNKHFLGDSGVETSAEASQVLAFTLLRLTSVQTLWLIIAEVPVYNPHCRARKLSFYSSQLS